MLLGVSNQKYHSPPIVRTIINIDSSTNDGINLFEYFKSKTGRVPRIDESVVFIVSPSVSVVGLSPQIPAIIQGFGWGVASDILIENRGRILGRGGNGGRSAYYHTMWNSSDQPEYNVNAQYSRPAEPGGTGGTAIEGNNILVENYGLIAGGGGGGGGLGIYAKTNTSHYFGGGGTGGGAPLGNRSPNECTYSMYVIDPAFPITKASKNYNGRRDYSAIYHRVRGAYLWNYGNYQGPNVAPGAPSWQETRGVNIEMDINNVYLQAADGFKTYIIDTSYTYSGIMKPCVPLIMSQNATLEQPGIGGANLLANIFHTDAGAVVSLPLTAYPDIPSVTANTRGGNGGLFGEDGESGVPRVLFGVNPNPKRIIQITPAEATWRQPSARGGFAGLIKEGGVIINNKPGGVTKGR